MTCKLSGGYSDDSCFALANIGGHTGKVFAFNYEAWQNATVTTDIDTGEITDIVLTGEGDQAFELALPRNVPKGSSPFQKGDNGGGAVHTCSLFWPSLNQQTKNEVAALINRNLWVIAVRNLDNTDAYWELYGFQSGLEGSVIDSQRAVQDVGNGLMFTLTTPTDTTLEKTFPLNINDGISKATTDEMMELLLTPVPAAP